MAAAPRSRRSQAVASRSAGSRTGAVRFACFVVLLAATDARAEDAAGIVLEELSVSAEGRPAPAAVHFGVSAPPGSSPSLIEQPLGATAARVGRTDTIENRPATSIGSVLLDSPGVTVRQGNGGRDVVISIRGNNARSTGVIRNMVVLEDGFLLTQPDGASRFDLVDPRAYSRIDVFRGPQSALFGNYDHRRRTRVPHPDGPRDRRLRDRHRCGQLRLPQQFFHGRRRQRPRRDQPVRQRRPRRRLPGSQRLRHADDQPAGELHPDTGQPLHPEADQQPAAGGPAGARLPRAVPDQPRSARLCPGGDGRARLHPDHPVRQRRLRPDGGRHRGRGRVRTRRPAHRRGPALGARPRRADDLAHPARLRRAQLRPAVLHLGVPRQLPVPDLPHRPHPTLRPDGPAGRGLRGLHLRDPRQPRDDAQPGAGGGATGPGAP